MRNIPINMYTVSAAVVIGILLLTGFIVYWKQILVLAGIGLIFWSGSKKLAGLLLILFVVYFGYCDNTATQPDRPTPTQVTNG